MYFLDLSNSDLCDRRIDMTIDLNCTLIEDALANAEKLKTELKAPSARLFTYQEPAEYEGIEVVVIVENGVKRYRAHSLNMGILADIMNHQSAGDLIMPYKYFLKVL